MDPLKNHEKKKKRVSEKEIIMKNTRRMICFALIMMMLISSMAFSVSAYNNGGKQILNGTTRIGSCQIWTNNSNTNRVLSGETSADEVQNSLTVRVAYTYFDDESFEKVQASWKSNSNAYARYVTVEYAVAENPIEARGQFAINSNIARICKMYNNGQGMQDCEDGASCPYNN